jgi:hypothetical protein
MGLQERVKDHVVVILPAAVVASAGTASNATRAPVWHTSSRHLLWQEAVSTHRAVGYARFSFGTDRPASYLPRSRPGVPKT